MGCRECIGRTPYASILATVLVVIGVGVFAGTIYQAMHHVTRDILESQFRFTVSWLEVVQVVLVVIAVVTGIFAFILLIFGFLATGATRQNVYSGEKCIMGGRVSAIFFLVVSYLFTMAWMIIMALCVIPLVAYASLTSICAVELYEKKAAGGYCLRLSQFGIYRNQSVGMGQRPEGQDSICNLAPLGTFCIKVSEAGPLFAVAFAAAFLIILGMTHFMATLSSNYARISISKELTDYREAAEVTEFELSTLGTKWQPY